MSAHDDFVGYEPTIEQQHAGFTVTDLASADWAIRKLARARKNYREVADYVQEERERLNDVLSDAGIRADDTERFFGGLLTEYHLRLLEDDPKRKTIKLPSGELKARKNPDRVVIADPDAFVCAVGMDSPLVKVEAKPLLAEVKKALKDGPIVTADGEVVEGIEVVEGDVKVTVDTAEAIEPPRGLTLEPF